LLRFGAQGKTVFKYLIQIKKKAGMSRQAFVDYYENIHAPLVLKLLPTIRTYRRNYLVFDDPMLQVDRRQGDENDAGYDVLTECIFESRAEAAAFFAAFSQPEVFARIKADEDNFVEPGHAKVFIVETHESPLP
jgi:uncharacterized protein (TIGR02118 family)